MRVSRYFYFFMPLLAVFTLVFWSGSSQAARHVLLVGVGQYAAATGDDFKSLAGPEHDVASLREIAVRDWQVKPENIQVLIDSQGSKAAILQALDELVAKAKSGDSVFVYFSGHGTSSKWVDVTSQQSLVNMPDGTGALVPYDFDPLDSSGALRSADELADQLIIGRRDLRPRFEDLDRRKIHTWVVVDACYSGNAVRSASAENKGTPKQISIGHLGKRTRGYASRSAHCEDCSGKGQSNAYPYDHVVFYSAASESELALDLPASQTYDGRPHGAFTDSLLRVLDKNPLEQFNYKTLYRSVEESMKSFCNCRHKPVVLPQMWNPKKKKALNVVVLHGVESGNENAQLEPLSPVERDFSVQIADNARELRKLVKRAGYQLSDQYPAVRLRYRQGDLVATDTNEELIHRFNGKPGANSLKDWLSSREWLHNRMQADKKINRGMALEVKEGLTGNGAQEGSKVYFSAWLEKESRLLVLDSFGDGQLVVLYPKFKSEMAIQPAGQQLVLPAKNGNLTDTDKVDPIVIGTPFGTDSILAYAFSGDSREDIILLERFRRIANKDYAAVDQSSGLVRDLEDRLREPGVDASSIKLFTYPKDSE